jgi:hypothetical protein
MAVGLLGFGGALIALVGGSDGRVVDLTVLSTALVISDLVELRPANRSPLPIGFAIVVVLLRAASPTEYVIIIIATSVAAALLGETQNPSLRAVVVAEFLASGLGAGAAFYAVTDARWIGSDARVKVLVALASAAVVEILVADLVELVRERRIARPRERGADVAVVTSGILMAVGYGGLGGQGRLGLWGPALFSIPLLAAWYSFELLARTRRTFRQTVRALGVAPELGGLVRPGHVERVAELAVSLGHELGVSGGRIENLETAAWLHHLGAVCLDEAGAGDRPDASEVARAGAEMLRASHALASAGDIVGAEPNLHRSPNDKSEQPSDLMGQILKVASAYDELTEGDDSHAAWAVDALFTGPAYVYDGRVLTALEQVLLRRGVVGL